MIDPTQETLGSVLHTHAIGQPDNVAMIGVNRSITWHELDQEVNRVARLFASLGVQAGDAVGMCTSKRPEVSITFIALSRLGAIAAPVNFKLEPGRIAQQFATAQIKAVLLEAKLDPIMAPLTEHFGGRVVYLDEDGSLGGVNYASISEISGEHLGSDAKPDDICYYNYTSGTTGQPKAAVATHANILWNSVSGVDGLGMNKDDVFLGMFSVFSHPHELFNRALVAGCAMVIVDTMSPRVVVQLVAKHKITWMMAVPSFYEMMLSHMGSDELDTSSLRILESGGAWVSPDTLERLEARFGCGFMPVWGSTETNGVALAMPPTEKRVPGATGKPVLHYTVGIFDDRGRPVEQGESGEMWVRGPAVSTGYVNMPNQTADAFSDGWYHTSDLVRQDEQGFFHFVGRKHDMLKVGGIRVYPLEIEQVLVTHVDIAEAVVVRAVERVRGEVPRAVIRLEEGSTMTAKQVRAFCREHMAVYKAPRIVEFWDEIPKLPNGKVDRRKITATT